MTSATLPEPTVTCGRCGARYDHAAFVATHPGPYADDAFRAALVTTPVRCAQCPFVVLDRTKALHAIV